MFDSPSLRFGCVITFLFPLIVASVSFAGGKRPAVQRLRMQGEQLTRLTGSAGVGGVAQSGVSAAIYRSTGCGFQSWIGGIPSWLDEQVFFNDGGNGAPLRSMSVPTCYDTCHRACGNDACNAGTCAIGPGICDCLDVNDFPITATFQMWDGDPCGSGVMIAGAGGSVTITSNDITAEQLRDGTSKCFDLTVTIDPKVVVPHNVWVEAIYGHDDGWPLTGRPLRLEGQGDSPLSGLNDGVSCVTFCDFGDPNLCTNDGNRCDWILSNTDSNADFVFILQPRSGGAGTVVGQEIILSKGGVRVDFDIFVSDFDPAGTGVLVNAWQSGIDSSGYTSALHGTLTPVVIPCNLAGALDQCSAANLGMGDGSVCNAGSSTCEAAYITCHRPDSMLGCTAIAIVCDVSNLDYVCASTLSAAGVPTTGADTYLWSLALDVSPAAKGTFTIDLQPPPFSILLSTTSQFLPLAGLVPAQVTIQTGVCCDPIGSSGLCVGEGFTANECVGADLVFGPGKTCGDCDQVCLTDEDCDGGIDACLVGSCVNNFCEFEPPPPDYCCGLSRPSPRDDGNPCTLDTCSGGGILGEPVHTLVAPGTPCDDGDDCTISDACNADGICTGEDNPFCSAIPTTSAWGVVLLALLLLVIAKIRFGLPEAPID